MYSFGSGATIGRNDDSDLLCDLLEYVELDEFLPAWPMAQWVRRRLRNIIDRMVTKGRVPKLKSAKVWSLTMNI